ncbi:MAG: hypothetical protein WCS42_14055 [Verrucomicrobiota bacterium]
MQIIVRTYYGKGTRKLFDLLENHHTEVERLMRAIDGLVSYSLARNGTGGFSVTVCRNKRGINQSVQTARRFIAEHAPEMSLDAMDIFEGAVITHFQGEPAK